MTKVILTTLNAKYIHASLGLRYLLANMGHLAKQTHIVEFTLDNRAEDIVEQLLSREPRIIGFGVYIWNAVQTLQAIRLIKLINPSIRVVIGGPEVSFEMQEQEICDLADYILPGQPDLLFGELCEDILAGTPPERKIQSALPLKLLELKLPYHLYTENDIANRVIYVEASRGCPFKCEFCLSSLDKTATPFPLDEFLAEIALLMERGARHYKFVDRTFNLKVDTCLAILGFFERHLDKELFLHFELIPDRLPERLKEKLPVFPAGMLQFEIGIQSFNPEVQALVSRRQNMQKTCNNMRWLRDNTTAHIHADLIFGLPGESLQSFGEGFDRLWQLGPQEIQVGLLKRLRGTPIDRHTQPFEMRYQSTPPYRIMQTSLISFVDMQRMARFARYWDLIANSGRFNHTLPLILGNEPFKHFLALSDWLYADTRQTHKISMVRLFKLLHRGVPQSIPSFNDTQASENGLLEALASDYQNSGHKGTPEFLRDILAASTGSSTQSVLASDPRPSQGQRQQRHLVS